jgi:hypothetical protein
MVDMRVRQQHHIDIPRPHGARAPIPSLIRPLLKQAAVNHDLLSRHVEDVPGPSHLPVRAKEMESHGEGSVDRKSRAKKNGDAKVGKRDPVTINRIILYENMRSDFCIAPLLG